MRRKRDQKKWAAAGLAALGAAAALGIARALWRRRSHVRTRPSVYPPDAYGLEDPPYLPPSEMGLPMTSKRIPVTARKQPRKQPAGAIPGKGGAVMYTVPTSDVPSSPMRRSKRTIEEEQQGFPWRLLILPLLILAAFTIYSMIGSRPARLVAAPVPGGNPENGRRLIQEYGCGSCHVVPGVAGAYGKAGPKLDQMAEQTYIAGMLSNNPENLIRWIMFPQEIQPGNAMPNMDVGEESARDIAAFLYSLR